MHYGTVKTLTNIRNTPPGGTYQDIGDLYAGDEVTADEIRPSGTSTWWHLTEWKRGGVARTLPGPVCWAWGANITELLPDLPATWEHTLVAKDSDGNILATYKGILAKQP